MRPVHDRRLQGLGTEPRLGLMYGPAVFVVWAMLGLAAWVAVAFGIYTAVVVA